MPPAAAALLRNTRSMAVVFPKEPVPYGESFYWEQRYNKERKQHGQQWRIIDGQC